MEQNILILGTGAYVPKHKVYNNYFEKHFHKMGIEIKSLIENLGRRKRYFADANESSLSMGYNASLDVLNKISMPVTELDMIVFVSDTPEYTFPTNALMLNHKLEAKNAHTVFDLNQNCIGMLTAIDLVSRYMQSKTSIKNALIVGSFLISSIVSKDDSITYPICGDCAAALILHNENATEKRGFIDSTVYTDSSYYETIMMPVCGYSNIYSKNIPPKNNKLRWTPFDYSFLSDIWHDIIMRLLSRNNLEPDDIDYYIFSQLSDFQNMATLKKLGVKEDKYIFVGKEYGYTGSTSPILTLNRAWSFVSEKGNKVVFCSVACGLSATALLYQF